MITTYAVSLPTKKWSDEIRRSCIETISNWLHKHYPQDRQPENLSLRLRHSEDDPVYRIEISELFKTQSVERHILITLAPHSGKLVFEVRIILFPLKDSIIPRNRVELPPKPVLALCAQMAQLLQVFDAEHRVLGDIRIVRTSIDGQTLAADGDAHARRLPIVVEFIGGKSQESSITGALASLLVGVAHVAHVATKEALLAFNEFRGDKTLSESYITILWPRPVEPLTIFDTNPSPAKIGSIILEAAAATPILQVPRKPRNLSLPSVVRTISRPMIAPKVASDHETDVKMTEILLSQIEESRAHIDQLDEILEQTEVERDELFDNLQDLLNNAEHATSENARLEAIIRKLVVDKIEYEKLVEKVAPELQMRSVLDALNRAKNTCTNLRFAPSALETGSKLHGPNPGRLYRDLRELDTVVAEWRKGDFPIEGLRSRCLTAGLTYVPNIGVSTSQKHSDFYSIIWNGKPILLSAHLARGTGGNQISRIYMYVDQSLMTIVIGKVVRHGPDRTSD